MRRAIIILCIFSCMTASGQERKGRDVSISADMTSIIIDRSMRFGFSHSFSSVWSAEGSVSVPFRGKRRIKGEDEHEHESMFSEEDSREESRRRTPEFRMGIRYWPGGFLEGGYMELSCAYNMENGTDMIMGCGYAVRIWKGLGMTAGYELRLSEGIREGGFGAEGIKIGITYEF